MLKVFKMSKKMQDLKGCRTFEQWRHCTSGKAGHLHSGKPKHLWLHKENERKQQHWLVPLASGLKQPKRETERVGYSPQTPFIWESRLPGTKPGNGWTFPSKSSPLPAQVLTCTVNAFGTRDVQKRGSVLSPPHNFHTADYSENNSRGNSKDLLKFQRGNLSEHM